MITKVVATLTIVALFAAATVAVMGLVAPAQATTQTNNNQNGNAAVGQSAVAANGAANTLCAFCASGGQLAANGQIGVAVGGSGNGNFVAQGNFK